MKANAIHKKSSTRMLKVECGNSDCGFIFRASRKQLDKLFANPNPVCPCCQRCKLKES